MATVERKIKREEQKIPDLALKAVNKAFQKARRKGSVYITIQDAGWRGVVEVFTDGTQRRVKPVELPTSVKVGTQARIK